MEVRFGARTQHTHTHTHAQMYVDEFFYQSFSCESHAVDV